VGYAANGAIVHREATPEDNSTFQPKGLLLCDSGAHYRSGTTDITRTIALGATTPEERLAYTLVLKGNIALSRCKFPEGTTGIQLDTAARYAMWQEGYDFGHGTGHGVGSRLCVHEGPHQIRKNVRPCSLVPFKAGMTVTNEPGIYVEGKFGIRIENLLLAVEHTQTPYGKFLRFETLTLCPIDTRPIDFSILSPAEKDWLNAYHAQVRNQLMPLLSDAADQKWLEKATARI
jgi:Xaa-Pro aminopeptidase